MKGPDRLCLVSDCSRALDTPPGVYRVGHHETGEPFENNGTVGVLPGGSVLAMRDETPFGEFLEIEGEAAEVSAVASTLGFEPSSYIRESYIGIQAALCRARGVPLQDLVFE